jgi:CheY-like chemotaxis protein
MIKSDIERQENNYPKECSYELILMDCNMPELDGFETTFAIRQLLWENNIKQPIILAVTGHTEQLYINRAIKCGMNRVLSKPVEFEYLREIL